MNDYGDCEPSRAKQHTQLIKLLFMGFWDTSIHTHTLTHAHAHSDIGTHMCEELNAQLVDPHRITSKLASVLGGCVPSATAQTGSSNNNGDIHISKLLSKFRIYFYAWIIYGSTKPSWTQLGCLMLTHPLHSALGVRTSNRPTSRCIKTFSPPTQKAFKSPDDSDCHKAESKLLKLFRFKHNLKELPKEILAAKDDDEIR